MSMKACVLCLPSLSRKRERSQEPGSFPGLYLPLEVKLMGCRGIFGIDDGTFWGLQLRLYSGCCFYIMKSPRVRESDPDR